MLTFETVNEAYYEMSKLLINKGKHVNNTHELNNVIFQIKDVREPFAVMRGTSDWGLPIEYNLAELIWYFSASNSVKYIGSFAKLWNKIKNEDDETVNSAYGYILHNKFGFDQLQVAIEALLKDENTRRATIKFNTPHFELSNTGGVIDASNIGDEVCTMYADFMIRDNKLNMAVSMRSNDIWSGFSADVVYFTCLQKLVLHELNKHGHNYELGTYTHHANSFHVYDRQFERLSKLVEDYKPEKVAPGKIDVLKLKELANQCYFLIMDKIDRGYDKKELNKFVYDLCVDSKILVLK